MPPNIFENKVGEKIIERINRLKPNNEKQWGSMSVEEMMHHCRGAIIAVINSVPKDKKPTLKQKLIKFYFLNIAGKFPKDVQAPKQINMKNRKAKVGDFAAEKSHLIKSINDFRNSVDLHAIHPYFGKLTTKEWGVFTWMHLDHHLRQFGV